MYESCKFHAFITLSFLFSSLLLVLLVMNARAIGFKIGVKQGTEDLHPVDKLTHAVYALQKTCARTNTRPRFRGDKVPRLCCTREAENEVRFRKNSRMNTG